MSLLDLIQINKGYVDQSNKILDCVDLSLNSKTINIITGMSGSGKSTLLHIAGLLNMPDAGEVKIDNMVIDYNQSSSLRNLNIGFVYQQHHLLPDLSVAENVAMPLMIRGVKKHVAIDEGLILLNKLDLFDYRNSNASNLSGGQKQRVAVARALVTSPKIVIADEPTGNLDKVTANYVYSLFTEFIEHNDATVLIATHDELFFQYADNVLHLESGALIKQTLPDIK